MILWTFSVSWLEGSFLLSEILFIKKKFHMTIIKNIDQIFHAEHSDPIFHIHFSSLSVEILIILLF